MKTTKQFHKLTAWLLATVMLITLLSVTALAEGPGDLNFEATPGDGTITVTWDELKEKDVNYIVFSSNADGENYTEHKDEYQCTDGKYTYVIEGLENNKTYTVGVEAVSESFEYGNMSAAADETPYSKNATVPDAPIITELIEADKTITVFWESPANDGGAKIIGYEIECWPEGSTDGNGGMTIAVDADVFSYTVDKLPDENINYDIKICAINPVGRGEYGIFGNAPEITGISFKTDSVAYNEETNTYTVSQSEPFVVYLTGVNFENIDESFLNEAHFGFVPSVEKSENVLGASLSKFEEAGIKAIIDSDENKITLIFDYSAITGFLGGESAFEGRTGILSVNLKNTEAVFGAAFRNCSGMTNLVANYLKTISGGNAFNGCSSLTMLTLPALENVTGNQNFANNTSLRKVYLQNVVSLGTQTFHYCSNLEEVVINKKLSSASDIPVAEDTFSDDVRADLPIRVPAASMSYYNGSWQSRPVLAYGETVTVGNESFVVLPMNGGYVIQSYIGGAESVILPDTLDSLNIVGLEENAFGIVTQTITSVTLPEHLYFLGSDALSELPYLEEITVNENNRFFTSADGVLYSKDGMMLVKYPCGKADTSFNVNDTVAAIGANAFKNAFNLQTVVFGSGLGVIDSTSFSGCKNLKQVTFTGTVPPILMGSSIFDTNVTDFAMTVPAGSIETYIRAFNFAEYASFINGGTEIPESGMMNIVNWQPAIIQETNTYALSPKEDDEDDDDGDDGEKEPETDI